MNLRRVRSEPAQRRRYNRHRCACHRCVHFDRRVAAACRAVASVEEPTMIEKVHVRSLHLPVHCSNQSPNGRAVLQPQSNLSLLIVTGGIDCKRGDGRLSSLWAYRVRHRPTSEEHMQLRSIVGKCLRHKIGVRREVTTGITPYARCQNNQCAFAKWQTVSAAVVTCAAVAAMPVSHDVCRHIAITRHAIQVLGRGNVSAAGWWMIRPA